MSHFLLCRWSHPSNFYLSDRLLTAIESKDAYLRAFGFFPSPDGSTSSGGDSQETMCGELADEAIFNDPAEKYAHIKREAAAESCRNRIHKCAIIFLHLLRASLTVLSE